MKYESENLFLNLSLNSLNKYPSRLCKKAKMMHWKNIEK